MLSVRVGKRRGGFDLEAAFEAPLPGIVALFGRSGCGKTTLVDMLAGLLKPDAGFLRIDDTTLSDVAAGIHLRPERRAIGYVFQEARLFPHLDVTTNLRYGERRARERAMSIGFDDVVDLLGLAPLLARRTAGLSGGEAQRVAIGRALLSRPRLLLLDEPFASLDAARRRELLPYLERLRDELRVPMVYVSHEFDEVLRLANHVVLLEQGRVLAQGPVGALSREPALRRIVGTEAISSLLEAVVETPAVGDSLAVLRVGASTMRLAAPGYVAGARLRLQLLARDLVLATSRPTGLSIRNALAGQVAAVVADSESHDLIDIEIADAGTVTASVTREATRELALAPGLPVWVLVKSVSLAGHAYAAPRAE